MGNSAFHYSRHIRGLTINPNFSVKPGVARTDFIEPKRSICVRTRLLYYFRLFKKKLLLNVFLIVQKEPKLARARQIPEWEEYDTEIAQFTRKLAEDGLIHSGMAAADTNVLANAGTGPTADSSKVREVDEVQRVEDVQEQPRDEL